MIHFGENIPWHIQFDSSLTRLIFNGINNIVKDTAETYDTHSKALILTYAGSSIGVCVSYILNIALKCPMQYVVLKGKV